jgi:uncharacterized cupredoxin-like copper-binding protein
MSKSKSKTGLYAVIAIIVIVIVVVGVVVALMYKPGTSGSGTPLTLYAGEVSSAQYGFGNSASTLTSDPGPTLNLKVGTTYTMTVHNVGTMPHAWEITSEKATGSALFGAQIDVTTYIQPGASASVTFTPNQAGNFYYLCPVPGHIDLGMWGNVVVTS